MVMVVLLSLSKEYTVMSGCQLEQLRIALSLGTGFDGLAVFRHC